MYPARHILMVTVLACAACAGAPERDATGEFSATTGIISRPNDTPANLDIATNVIPLDEDGIMPRMAVHVKRSRPKDFVLSYRVYRRVQGSKAYVLTETSPLWLIRGHGDSADAFIAPDFLDGILVGEYRFAIFIDQKPWRVVGFKIVPHGT